MALKAKLDSLDGLEEAQAGLYSEIEGGGGYVLDVEPVAGFALENVAGLKETLSDRKAKAAERKNALAKFEGIDPEKARTAIEKYEEFANWSPDQKAKEALEAMKAEIGDKFTKELDAEKTKRGSVETQLHALMIDHAATEAIIAAGGNPKLLLPHVKAQMSLVEEDGKLATKIVNEKGQPRVTMKPNSTEEMDLAELIESMKSSDDFLPAFAGSGATGGGGGGIPRVPGRSGGAKDVVLSYEDSQDYRKFQQAEITAKKQGGKVIIQDHPGWHQ